MQLGSLARLSARAARAPVRQQLRGAASHGPTGYGKGPYRGFSPPEPEPWKKACGTFFGTITFLWFFWRCKQDGRAFLVRRAPRPSHTLCLSPSPARAPGRRVPPANPPALTIVVHLRGRASSTRGTTMATTTVTVVGTIDRGGGWGEGRSISQGGRRAVDATSRI